MAGRGDVGVHLHNAEMHIRDIRRPRQRNRRLPIDLFHPQRAHRRADFQLRIRHQLKRQPIRLGELLVRLDAFQPHADDVHLQLCKLRIQIAKLPHLRRIRLAAVFEIEEQHQRLADEVFQRQILPARRRQRK